MTHDDFMFAGQAAASALWDKGRIPAEGYPVTRYTMSGSWQAKAWRTGFDFIRKLQQQFRQEN